MSLFSTRRDSGTARMPIEGRMPGFEGATGWLNSEPLTEADLRGKVVLVDFWTYTCINWLRTLGYVRAWAEKYADQGLVVVGVHTPEFPFEHDVDNVRRAAKDLAVEYPIALDSDYAIWRAFSNRYWPAVYIADVEGRIRHHQFGEGGYEVCERTIQLLLQDAGQEGVGEDLVSVADHGIEAQADWTTLQTPETYLGSEQGQNLANGAPDQLELNQWALSGDWTVEAGASVLNAAGGRIRFRFHARDVHLVLRAGESVPFQVLLDGEPPRAAHGLDVDEEGNGTLVAPRLYQLIRQQGAIADRTFEIAFQAPGVEAYAFTFG
jgi:thiol-disulfide isomerase/thioredoxin